MADVVFALTDVSVIGKPFIINTGDDQFGTVFAVRINLEPVQGGLEIPPASRIDPANPEWLVAFSNICTHMGCALIPAANSSRLEDTYLAGPCPCHMTLFDLSRGGMVVVGPATEALPQLSLQLIEPTQKMVRIVDWIRDKSVPYGLPYGRTTQIPSIRVPGRPPGKGRRPIVER